MTEYTIVTVVELTDITTLEERVEDLEVYKKGIEYDLCSELAYADAHVKDIKVFPREVEA